MKVRELIAKLQAMDPEKNVLVSVRTQTSRYSLAECVPFDIDHAYGAATIHISLPKGLYIARNKRSAVSV